MFRPALCVVLGGVLFCAAVSDASATPMRPAGGPAGPTAVEGTDAAVQWPKEVMVPMPKDPLERQRTIRRLRREHGRVLRTVASRMRTRPDLDFERTSVKNVLEYLAEIGNFSIIFDNTLQEQGIDLATQAVTLKVSGITYEKAIELILPPGVGYRIGPGYVLITTMEKSWLPLRTASYSIRLHLARVPDFKDAPRFNIGDMMQAASQAAGGGAGGIGDIFGGGDLEPDDEEGLATPERIIDLVKRFVAHENDRRIAPWAEMGGPATIEYLNGRLIVNQTDAGHRAVWRLLTMLE